MVFLSICTALYDYTPQGEGELAIQEGELVYVLEKSTEDDWWKARKKATNEDEAEPVGLIPYNYVGEAQPTYHAKALYDYTRQTDEELSFPEDSTLSVYDNSDPDWTLVGLNGEYGFAPANYIEIEGEAGSTPSPALPARPIEDVQGPSDGSSSSAPTAASQGPAAALAGILSGTSSAQRGPPLNTDSPPRAPQRTPEASYEDTPPVPSLPQRPASQQMSHLANEHASPRSLEPPGVVASPPHNRALQPDYDDDQRLPPSGFHLYNINEMVSAMGKKKKLPTTLGINLATGQIMIAPEKPRDGPQQEWSAEKLTHYSIEGKHVFMELVKPSKSIDFHAGAKDTGHEIVAALGELAGVARAEGLREVIAAGSGTRGSLRRGQILYDFMAQGDDEVTVAVGDDVIVIDDTKSEEWWMVRRLKNGKEGVVPSSYVEMKDIVSPPPLSATEAKPGRSTVEQNRLEEERLARGATKASKRRESSDTRRSEVGPGMRLPERGSSLVGGNDNDNGVSQRSKRDKASDGSRSSSKPKPDTSKVRTWTDRSGSFKVEAEFIGLKDGKIHLHKLNGVKIAVPVSKMAPEDLEYVERVTNISLDEDKPLSDIKRKNQKVSNGADRKLSSDSTAGASVRTKQPEYDWFDFFLKCGVSPYQCERYASNFNRDSMDESVLPDITPSVLRTLGLKEGDILRVMKYLDSKHGRTGAKSKLRNVSFGGEEVMGNEDDTSSLSPNSTSGGLFSGPGGTLRNNTRKGRPAPAVQTNDTVDPKVFQQKDGNSSSQTETTSVSTPGEKPPPPVSKVLDGFDDDAWDVKPSKQQSTPSQPSPLAKQPLPPAPSQPPPTGAMADLSLLSAPLQPTILQKTGPSQPQNSQKTQPWSQQPSQQQLSQARSQQQQPLQFQEQPTGANPNFFSQLTQQPTGMQYQQSSGIQGQPQPAIAPQQTGQGQTSFQLGAAPRQRPQPPQQLQQSSAMLPPPPRPLSAPQNVSQQSNFGPPPLQPQLTGAPYAGNNQNQSGPSMNDLNVMRLQQQQYNQQAVQPQLTPQMTGFGQQNQQVNPYGNTLQTQQTGQISLSQPQLTGFQHSSQFTNGPQSGSPFADPRTGMMTPISSQSLNFPQPYQQSPVLQSHQTGSINSFLSPALQPQITGINGVNRPGFGQSPQQHPSQMNAPPMPPVPPLPQQAPAPLQPQKTGPAPPVRFGTTPDANKLMPQATGRKANLSQATPQNPFGF